MSPSNFEWDAISLIGVTITLFNWFIFVPTIIYGLYQFHKFKTDELIIYRHPSAVTLMNIMVIIGLLIERMYILLVSVIDIAAVPAWSVHFVFALTWNAVIYLKVAQIYYIYFCQQYNLALADIIWKQNINDDSPQSFYIKYKDTYGNMSYLMKLMILPYVIVAFLDATVSAAIDHTPNFYGDVWELDIFHVIEMVLPLLVGFVVLYKSRLVNDIYKIRNEVSISMLIMGISFVLFIIIFFIRRMDSNLSVDLSRMSSLTSIFIMEGVAVSCSILATLYPVHLIKQKQQQNINQKMTHHIIESNSNRYLQTMDKIMSKYDSFKVFMSYLVTEFSPELMLFMVELMQVKIAYQKKHKYMVKILIEENGIRKNILVNFNINPNNNSGMGFHDETERNFTYIFHLSGSIMTKLSLPMDSQLPISKILQKYPNSLYYQMAALYKKYVECDSEFELNISGSVRDQLKQIFDEKYATATDTLVNGQKRLIPVPMDQRYLDEQLFNIMDEIALEIIQLLQYSFVRFTDCNEFHALNVEVLEVKNNYAVFNDAFSNVKPVSCSAYASDGTLKDYLNDTITGIITKNVL